MRMSRNRRSKCIFIRLVQLINLLVPPVYPVSKTIHHFLASSYKARAVLVCSRWPSTTFWPLLHKKVNKFHEIVYDSFTLKDTTNYIKLEENEKSFIDSKNFKGEFLVYSLELDKNFTDYHYYFTNLLFVFYRHYLSGDFEKVLPGKQKH